eukprot:CAMPEP_0184658842 /NCGR_PEP_ID=MMETSP0308-20130426/27111_1 /TAXON_ID=38269 /ORGANISM="Gloeochaete witrockiana, Strain SAG 46.84" /LENGTH=194 /DNA_ID=CAMNT_0027098155 /DNA_START=355 /DNA_END=939 /DNA_ORIENTATION=+
MFKEVLETEEKLYGVVWHDNEQGALAAVGVVFSVSESQIQSDGRIILNSDASMRFKVTRILQKQPFLKAECEPFDDEAPKNMSDTVALAKAESSVWECMQDLLRLSNKLYERTVPMSEELLRFAPGNASESMSNFERQVHFSFLVASTIELSPRDHQLLLQDTSPVTRLNKCGALLSQARKFLVAKTSLKDALD